MNGCTEYTEAIVKIYFAKGEERCQYCPMFETYSRDKCNRTGEYVVDRRGRGMWCPLEFITKEGTEEHDQNG